MCVSQSTVRCPRLFHYYHEKYKKGPMTPTDVWVHIKTFLPNIGSISDGAQDYEEYYNEPLTKVQEY